MLELAIVSRFISGLLIASALSYRGYYKSKSLSSSGALAALLVGTITFTANMTFGLVLIAFYLMGSVVTRIGSVQKQKFDGEYRKGGQRDIWQVLSNGGLGTLLSLLYLLNEHDEHSRNMIVVAYLSVYSCCLGDTFASELGVLSSVDPWLITSLKRVQRGTNGAVSVIGTAASLLGGLFIGLIYMCLEVRIYEYRYLFICGVASILGSLIDSILGALFQATFVDERSGKIYNSKTVAMAGKKSLKLKNIGGYDFLSNNQVYLFKLMI